jgi:hypothetical protein
MICLVGNIRGQFSARVKHLAQVVSDPVWITIIEPEPIKKAA